MGLDPIIISDFNFFTSIFITLTYTNISLALSLNCSVPHVFCRVLYCLQLLKSHVHGSISSVSSVGVATNKSSIGKTLSIDKTLRLGKYLALVQFLSYTVFSRISARALIKKFGQKGERLLEGGRLVEEGRFLSFLSTNANFILAKVSYGKKNIIRHPSKRNYYYFSFLVFALLFWFHFLLFPLEL